jgi:hypothetical protein
MSEYITVIISKDIIRTPTKVMILSNAGFSPNILSIKASRVLPPSRGTMGIKFTRPKPIEITAPQKRISGRLESLRAIWTIPTGPITV